VNTKNYLPHGVQKKEGTGKFSENQEGPVFKKSAYEDRQRGEYAGGSELSPVHAKRRRGVPRGRSIKKVRMLESAHKLEKREKESMKNKTMRAEYSCSFAVKRVSGSAKKEREVKELSF